MKDVRHEVCMAMNHGVDILEIRITNDDPPFSMPFYLPAFAFLYQSSGRR
jgi:hypothetical protein